MGWRDTAVLSHTYNGQAIPEKDSGSAAARARITGQGSMSALSAWPKLFLFWKNPALRTAQSLSTGPGSRDGRRVGTGVGVPGQGAECGRAGAQVAGYRESARRRALIFSQRASGFLDFPKTGMWCDPNRAPRASEPRRTVPGRDGRSIGIGPIA